MAAPAPPLPQGHIIELAPPHPKKDEIIRQVEYYFSDENLPTDPHLLALAGGNGNGFVKIKEICSFRKMKGYKPLSEVKAALRLSDKLELSDDNMSIKRKSPLEVPIEVLPQVGPEKRGKIELTDQPWLTKGMLKPTGFEQNAVEGPITPEVFNEERELYHPDICFSIRIEDGVNHFARSKKMHQQIRHYFTKFMLFGGFVHGNQFAGGVTTKELKKQGADQHEIDRLTAQYSVNEMVHHEFDATHPTEGRWVVDFCGLAKAFLSSHFPTCFAPFDEREVETICNVLRTFYDYLRYHGVCPEFDDDLKMAREFCSKAAPELVNMAAMDRLLPGSFNVACSTLFGGCMAGVHRPENVEWHEIVETSNLGQPHGLAVKIFMEGVMTFGTQEQIAKVDRSKCRSEKVEEMHFDFQIVGSEYEAGLRVLNLVKLKSLKHSAFYPENKLCAMTCERWDVPYAAPRDLPAAVRKRRKQETFTFIVSQQMIKVFVPGVFLVADIKQLDIGISWLDKVLAIHPSFFTYLPNEHIFDFEGVGGPTEWMKRQNAKKAGLIEDDQAGADQDGGGHNAAVANGAGQDGGQHGNGADSKPGSDKKDSPESDHHDHSDDYLQELDREAMKELNRAW